MEWSQSNHASMNKLHLTHEPWGLSVIPELGGKICSITWRGKELLAQNPRKPYRRAPYGAPYADFDASGFDECFPTIGSCQYPAYPWEGTELPDHGELWSLPWTHQFLDDRLCLSANGIRVPYRFSKSIWVMDQETIRFSYRLDNITPFPFRYLWSSHPLFAPTPGMKILLPAGTAVRIDWSRDGRLGEIWQELAWPETRDAQGRIVDLSVLPGPEVGWVDKLYTSRLTQGWSALYSPQERSYLAFTFSPEQVPYVGLSINMGGWPVEEPGYYNLGLEPCCGYPDRLDLAIQRGAYRIIEPLASVEWDIDLHAGETGSEASLRNHLSTLAAAHASSH